MRRRRAWLNLSSLAFAGGIAAFGQAPWNAWYLTLAGFLLLFWRISHSVSPIRAGLRVWAFGAGYFAVALSWIVEPFLVDIPRHGWMAPFAILLLAGGLAGLWALAGYVALRFAPRQKVAALIVTLSLIEMSRMWLFTGFPWAMIGHVWIDTPVRMLATLAGAPGLTLLTLLIAGLPFLWSRRWIGGAVALGLGATAFGYGALAIGGAGVEATDKRIRLVQPNATQHLKWDQAMIPVFFRRLVDATADPAPVDLIVWPESALAVRLDRAGEALPLMAAAAKGVPVVFGVNDFANGAYYNAATVLRADGSTAPAYRKHHLVPFGEYIPLAGWLGQLGIGVLTEVTRGGFASGPGPQTLQIEGIGPALPLICYEMIFPRNLRLETRPNVILHLTNDAWFGIVSGPYQHLAQARLRATEQALPVLRAANTGVSAVIDPVGRVLHEIPLGTQGHLDATLPAPLPPTLYARLGDWPLGAVLIVSLFGLSAFGRRRND